MFADLKSTEMTLMQCVINSVAKLGFENASIKAIAKEAGVAVSTIYCHYDSKETMFEETFMQVAKVFCEFYSVDVSDLVYCDQMSSFHRLWDHYLDFFLKNPETVLFYVRYRHSAYYTEGIRMKVYNYETRFFSATERLASAFGVYIGDGGAAGAVLRFFIEMLLLYSEQRLLNKASPVHDELAFQSMYGAVCSLQESIKSGSYNLSDLVPGLNTAGMELHES